MPKLLVAGPHDRVLALHGASDWTGLKVVVAFQDSGGTGIIIRAGSFIPCAMSVQYLVVLHPPTSDSHSPPFSFNLDEFMGTWYVVSLGA